MPRFHCPCALASGAPLALPAATARHVQVLRMQPGDGLTLFDGAGGEFNAVILRMGRADVEVEVGTHHAVEREAPRAVHLALGMPANERMDWLVEKAVELGVASIQPLLTERSVLRLAGERASKKQAHWQAIAVAACEQSGRNRVPPVHPIVTLERWLPGLEPGPARRMLSLRADARPVETGLAPAAGVWLLSGPEGGLSVAEEEAALAQGFAAATLGPRVLRADTAPLAALAVLTVAR